MRSKTSSFKLFMELFRKQLWVFALSCFGYFLIGPVLFLMRISEWEEMSAHSWTSLTRAQMTDLLLSILRFTEGSRIMLLFVLGTLAVGVVSAWNGFSWLHARNQVDLYHALPVKRQKLYLIHVLIGIADYAVPALGWLILTALVVLFKNLFTPAVLAALFCDWLLGLLFSIYAFVIAALAMMLTGRVLVGVLGTGVFFFLDMLIGILAGTYQDAFFRTFTGSRSDMFSAFGPAVLSPLYITVRAFEEWYSSSGWILPLEAVLASLIIGALALFVYLKRPSEAAGRSMAFFKVGEGIRLVLCVAAALCFGIIFGEMTGTRSDFWFLFGLVLGFLFIYALIQLIYTMDIRKCFSGKGILIGGLVLTLGIAAFFRFDLMGYDSYLPKKEEIESVAVSVDYSASSMYDSNIYQELRMEHAAMPCDEEVYSVLERFVSGSKIYWASNGEEGPSTYRTVRVTLKNGKTYEREYEMYTQDVEEQLFLLYQKKEYAEATWPILAARSEQMLGLRILYCDELVADDTYMDYGMNDTPMLIPEKEKARELFEALREDLLNGDAKSFLREVPYAIITCQMDLSGAQFGEVPTWMAEVYDWETKRYKPADSPVWEAGVPVYPSFERTGKILKELGIGPVAPPDAEDVEKILLIRDDENSGVMITDRDEISRILSEVTMACGIPQNNGSPTNEWTSTGTYVTIYLKGEEPESARAYSGFLPEEDQDVLVLSDRLQENREAASEQITETP